MNMRKVEDITDMDDAICCNSQEEWDAILEILPKGTCKSNNYTIHGNCVTVDAKGWASRDYYKNNNVYEASEFLNIVINNYSIF